MPNIPNLPWDVPIVDIHTGLPTKEFQQWWQTQTTSSTLNAVTGELVPPVIALALDTDGTVLNYITAESEFVIKTLEGVDVSSNFTLSTAPGGNATALSVTYTNQTINITGGMDSLSIYEAFLTVRATGTGDYAGKIIDKTLKIVKGVQGLVSDYVMSANDRNALIPDTPSPFTAITKETLPSGNVNVEVAFGFTYNTDPAHKNNVDGFMLFVWEAGTSASHTMGTSLLEEITIFYPLWALGTTFHPWFLRDRPADKWYTFGVAAYRKVHFDIDSRGYILSAIAQTGPYRPETTQNFTGYVDGVSATVVGTATTNFNGRNDRDNSAITGITIDASGFAIDHTINTDSTSNISFEWDFPSAWEPDIDYFEVAVVSRTSSSAYTIGTTAALEKHYVVPPNVRSFYLYGVATDLYYTFGVRAVRVVDPDIDTDGFIFSSWSQSAVAGENPYRPSASVAFTGDISGTVGFAPSSRTTGAPIDVYWGGGVGGLIAGQYFKFQLKRYKGSTDVTTSATWTVEDANTHTVSVSNGLVDITGFSSGRESYILISSTYEGVKEEYLLPVNYIFGNINAADGEIVAQGEVFGGSGITSTTYADASGVLKCATGPNGDAQVYCIGIAALESAGSGNVQFKIQRRTIGGAWTDVTTSTSSSLVYDETYPDTIIVGVSNTDTGLAASTDYEWKIQVARQTGGTAPVRFLIKNWWVKGT